MWFGVLGPLLVRSGAADIKTLAGRQRSLLAALITQAGRPRSVDELVEILWDGAPPAGAEATVRAHVMRLRRALGPAAGARIVTRYPGYLAVADEGEIDLLRFSRLCEEGGAAARAGAWEESLSKLTGALQLWRGVPLADIPSDLLRQDQVPRIEQLHLQALESRVEAALQLGHHQEVISELEELAGTYPVHERFHAQLMLALYRSGRRAEALAAYQRCRCVLAEELGVEPGPELRELHQRILAVGSTLTTSAVRDGSGQAVSPPTVPKELPGPVMYFTGRAAELGRLTGLLARPGLESPEPVVICAICGMAGVGKTALAVRAAHRVSGLFPDGQLYVDLRGYDPGPPMAASEALAGFLRSLGVAGPDIPVGTEERAARFRSRLAGLKVLVVLDNAQSAAQVRPLLPGSPGSAAIVTSRDALSGLVARDGAQRLDLDALPLADAVALLRELIGTRAGDAEAAIDLAEQCTRLPLALRIAAELVRSRPGASLRTQVDELADYQRRIELMDSGGDESATVRAVFSWSYRQLEPSAKRAFRLACLHPDPVLEARSLAALTGTTVEAAARVLGQLASARLVDPVAADHYAMHDLVRAYAFSLACAEHVEDERRRALTRLFDYYLACAAAATKTAFPSDSYFRPLSYESAVPIEGLADNAAALAWLDSERGTLVSVAKYMAERDWPRHAADLAATMYRYLALGSHVLEAEQIHDAARAAANRADDRWGEATALVGLGMIAMRRGQFGLAREHLERAHSLFTAIDDRVSQARALQNLAGIDHSEGQPERAAERLCRALALYEQTGDRVAKARVLLNLSAVDMLRGLWSVAADHLHQALALAREMGDDSSEAHIRHNLGYLHLRERRYDDALDQSQRALALARRIGYRDIETSAMTTIGLAELEAGSADKARDHLKQATDLARIHNDRTGETKALIGQAEVLMAIGQPEAARGKYAYALDVAAEASKYYQARAHEGLARCHETSGNPDEARRHGLQALRLYAEVGSHEAEQIRAHLDGPHESDG
jgi:DNA-binding SARP family transcriptional activator/Tfp pilus assembly protein PilF